MGVVETQRGWSPTSGGHKKSPHVASFCTCPYVDCVEAHFCHRDGAGELFIWSVLYFIDYEINELTLFLLDHTRVSHHHHHHMVFLEWPKQQRHH